MRHSQSLLLEVDVALVILSFTIMRPCAVSGARRRPRPLRRQVEMDTDQAALWAAFSPRLPRPLLFQFASDVAYLFFIL